MVGELAVKTRRLAAAFDHHKRLLPVKPELIQSLKEITRIGKNKQFILSIIEKIGTNTYLQKTIKNSIEKEANPSASDLKLRNTTNNL